MRNFSLNYCEELITTYVNEFGGQVIQINEGVLGLGYLLLHGAEGKKTIVINEYYINSWTSGHNIRMYNKTPKKYQKLIDIN
jgi:hypothetical protein